MLAASTARWLHARQEAARTSHTPLAKKAKRLSALSPRPYSYGEPQACITGPWGFRLMLLVLATLWLAPSVAWDDDCTIIKLLLKVFLREGAPHRN